VAARHRRSRAADGVGGADDAIAAGVAIGACRQRRGEDRADDGVAVAVDVQPADGQGQDRDVLAAAAVEGADAQVILTDVVGPGIEPGEEALRRSSCASSSTAALRRGAQARCDPLASTADAT